MCVVLCCVVLCCVCCVLLCCGVLWYVVVLCNVDIVVRVGWGGLYYVGVGCGVLCSI